MPEDEKQFREWFLWAFEELLEEPGVFGGNSARSMRKAIADNDFRARFLSEKRLVTIRNVCVGCKQLTENCRCYQDKRMVSVGHAVKVLQRAFEADPDAVSQLFTTSVKCNNTLAKDPTIQIRETNGDFAGCMLSALGLINGIFGVDENDWGAIAAKYCDETGELLGFVDNGREVKPK